MKNGPYELIIAPPNFPGKRYRNRYAYEHTVNWWKHTGQMPPKDYEIHHINGDHRDNRIENLRLLTWKEHHDLHSKMRVVVRIEKECGLCKKKIYLRKKEYEYRISIAKSRKVFCSRVCNGKNKN